LIEIPQSETAFRMLRAIALIFGLAIAAWGGVIAYRILLLEPGSTAVINTSTGTIREYPNIVRAAPGLLMFVGGAGVAFFAARRKPM
jgi:hypothetical protein